MLGTRARGQRLPNHKTFRLLLKTSVDIAGLAEARSADPSLRHRRFYGFYGLGRLLRLRRFAVFQGKA